MSTINYALAKKRYPRLKAALTRAKNSHDPDRVLDAVHAAFDEFDAWGAWPDQWSDWQVAHDDALGYPWLPSRSCDSRCSR